MESLPTDQGIPQRYGRNPRNRHPKKKSLEPSAPPDKDPVMLLNEFGQKRGQLVCMQHDLFFLKLTKIGNNNLIIIIIIIYQINIINIISI